MTTPPINQINETNTHPLPTSPDQAILVDRSGREHMISRTSSIWSQPPHELVNSVEKLYQTVKLQKQLEKLPNAERQSVSRLRERWHHLLEEKGTAALDEVVSDLDQLPPRLAFLKDELQPLEKELLEARVSGFIKTHLSALASSAVRSASGLEGALLIRHTWKDVTHEIAVKWTDPVESAACELFSLLAKHTRVPPGALLDFPAQSLISQERLPLGEDQSSRMQERLVKINSLCGKQLSKNSRVLISEYVQGQDLEHFTSETWKSLSAPQKTLFFEAIGETFLIDLLLGNTDRFFNVAFPFPEDPPSIPTTFDDYHSINLGNMLLRDGEGSLTLYAIDNAPYSYNLRPGREHDLYNTFFKDLLTAKDGLDTMAEALVASLARTCTEGEIFEEKDREERQALQEALGPFVRDVQTPETKAILLESLSSTKQRLIRYLSSDEGKQAFFSIENKYEEPLLFSSVKERIDLLLSSVQEAG